MPRFFTDEIFEHKAARRRARQRDSLRDGIVPSFAQETMTLSPPRPSTPDYVGAFAVTAGLAKKTSPSVSSARMTTTPPSSRKRCAIAWRKRSPEAMHAKVRRELWGYAPEEKLGVDSSSVKNIAASVPRPAIPRSPITLRRRRCSICSKRASARALDLTDRAWR